MHHPTPHPCTHSAKQPPQRSAAARAFVNPRVQDSRWGPLGRQFSLPLVFSSTPQLETSRPPVSQDMFPTTNTTSHTTTHPSEKTPSFPSQPLKTQAAVSQAN